MSRTIIALAAGLALAGGLALAQSTPPAPGDAPTPPSAERGHGRDHGQGEHKGEGRGMGHHGMGGHGMGGHGRGHDGRGRHDGGIWKSESAGFEIRAGHHGGLRVNCGETDIAACIAAAQPLIDEMGPAEPASAPAQ